jgi:hypothetical protein
MFAPQLEGALNSMKTSHRIVTGFSLAAALAAVPALSQGGAAGPARYTMDAGTTSGMGAMGARGGVGAAMSMLRGGSQVAHELYLKLGSSRAAIGEPDADHFMPSGARLGQSVPLITPAVVTGPAEMPQQGGPMQMPKGRLLLFWGCGEHAPAGQPVVIDFSKVARGQVPAGVYANLGNLPEAWSIHAGNAKTYGEWPNSRDSKRVEANSSLLGAHRVVSNYAPEISFELADDFMPALKATSNEAASGAVNLNWNAIAKATGYYAWAMAVNPEQNGEARDMVWWTSSGTQQFAGMLSDWLSPAAVRKLIDDKTVMPPTQTSCTVPAEVRETGGPMLMTNLYAYGPQADFSYPARPANAGRNWNPDWIARVRFRSNTMLMAGMPGMGDFSTGDDSAEAPASEPELPKCKGLSGIAKRAAGLCR